jgi:hypothetical protein
MAKTEKQLPAVSSAMQQQLAAITDDGFQNITAADLNLSLLYVLHMTSPQVLKGKEDYIPGAEAGQLLDTGSKKTYDELTVIPLGQQQTYVEWKPDRGGFVAKYKPSDPYVKQSTPFGNKMITPVGNDLVDTREFYFLVVPPEGQPYVAMMPLTSTRIATGRALLSDAIRQTMPLPDGTTARLPLYFQQYKLETVMTENDKGTWYNPKFTFIGPVPDELMSLAQETFMQFEAFAGKANDLMEANHSPTPNETTIDAVAASMK